VFNHCFRPAPEFCIRGKQIHHSVQSLSHREFDQFALPWLRRRQHVQKNQPGSVFLCEGYRIGSCNVRNGIEIGRKEHALKPMGTRNAAVRKLAIPDLTTTVLTLTITGIGADSSIACGNNPRLARRVEAVVAMFLGAAVGAVIIRYSISAAWWLGTAISALCSTALFRALRTPDEL
jgi:Protein of unknown function (DUF1275)